VLSASFLPLEGVDVAERQRRTSETATVEVDLVSGTLLRVGPRCLLAVRWDAKKQELVCVADPAGEITRFRKARGRWQPIRHPANPRAIEVSLREDINTRPRIYWRRVGDREPRPLLDLNPQFDELRYGKVEELNWEWQPGRRVSGSLYYPPDFEPGRRYPLVLQTRGRYPLAKALDGRAPSHFEMEGLTAVGYGGQALAARKVMVLQLDDWAAVANEDSHQEMNDTMLLYKRLVTHFVELGLVDSTRVGILGWSHSCGYVTWALTHEPSLFAAAAVSGESTGGYLSLLSRVDGGAGADIGKLYGGEPLTPHLQSWVDLAPSFNLHRVRAPIRLTVLSAPLYLSAQWEWFEGLSRLGKPADLVMFQSATHILRKPAERMAISGGNVDWFDFWLNGHEDPAAEKAEQYSRWRSLRALGSKSP
jgi:dipeptidyl aminopeptidase/acylaminoacyl peptidase